MVDFHSQDIKLNATGTHRNNTKSRMAMHSLLPHEVGSLLLTTNLACGHIFAIQDASQCALKSLENCRPYHSFAKHPNYAISDHYEYN